MFVCVDEFRDDGQRSVLTACEPLGNGIWIPRPHVQRGPHAGVGKEERSPIATDVCERDNLLGVLFGTVVNGKIEDPCQDLWGEPVRRSAFIQKGSQASYRGPQHLVQFSNLWWVG